MGLRTQRARCALGSVAPKRCRRNPEPRIGQLHVGPRSHQHQLGGYGPFSNCSSASFDHPQGGKIAHLVTPLDMAHAAGDWRVRVGQPGRAGVGSGPDAVAGDCEIEATDGTRRTLAAPPWHVRPRGR